MAKAVFFEGPRKAVVRQVELREMGDRDVRAKTLYSGISHGTEMQIYTGTAHQYTKFYDEKTKLYRPGKPGMCYPLQYGYMSVARVQEVGSAVETVKTGDIIASYHPHQDEYIIDKDEVVAVMPEHIPAKQGIFMANLVTTYNGILDGGINLGESVAVFGQGVLGLIAVKLAKLSGAQKVFAVDLIKKRLEMSKEFGADFVINPRDCKDVALYIKEHTDNRGVDIAYEVSSSGQGLNQAIRSVVYDGTVMAISWYRTPLTDVHLGEEFHVNRVRIKSTQVGGIGHELSNRWDKARRISAAINLFPQIPLEKLITHEIPFEDAPKAYELVDKTAKDVIQVMLKC
ncbi:MAG: zinc-binding alcohol dehydrogenase [Planctomycetota bacterium]